MIKFFVILFLLQSVLSHKSCNDHHCEKSCDDVWCPLNVVISKDFLCKCPLSVSTLINTYIGEKACVTFPNFQCNSTLTSYCCGPNYHISILQQKCVPLYVPSDCNDCPPGPIGPQGNVGPAGQNAAIESYSSYSLNIQPNINNNTWQVVLFENELSPSGSTWIKTLTPNDCSFTCPANGTYLISYKVDYRSGIGSGSTTQAVTAISVNQTFTIPSSVTYVEAPHAAHIYTIPNTFLVYLGFGDILRLNIWMEDPTAQIGDVFSIGKPPLLYGLSVNETTASIVITRITYI